ncbi:DUF1491 family protein [Magnetovibrio sp.]|uniref:DUF1491 family protein n=1 Tax=Magnetovibrio sp. TaxID=2024836 RepID=UPI002F92776D
MTEMRVKTEFWVKAQLRLCDQSFLPAVVARRGDRDAGQVLIKLNRLGRGCELLGRRFSVDGNRVWMVVAGGEGPDAEAACDTYIAREVDIDTDLWVIEIEDPDGSYLPDGQQPVRP